MSDATLATHEQHTSKLATTEIYTHIPAPVLQQMTEARGPDEVRYRFEEAQKIIDATFLPEKSQRKVIVIGRKK